MIILYTDKLIPLHNPQYTYQIKGRTAQKYPENGQRISNMQIEDFAEMKGVSLCKIDKLHPLCDLWMEKICSEDYMHWLKSCSTKLVEDNIFYGHNMYLSDDLTPITRDLMVALRWGVSLDLFALDQFLEKNNNCYVFCRPPGHHASASKAGGFCYINHIAMANKYLLSKSNAIKRIAILDLDLHLGNGTMEYMKDDIESRYFSIHLDPSACYPFFDEIIYKELSQKPQLYLRSLPKYTEETTYLTTLQEILSEIDRYDPDVLLLSMGYDTHESDPCNGFQLKTDSFKKIAKIVYTQFHKPIIAFHEGGYCQEVARETFREFLKGAVNTERR